MAALLPLRALHIGLREQPSVPRIHQIYLPKDEAAFYHPPSCLLLPECFDELRDRAQMITIRFPGAVEATLRELAVYPSTPSGLNVGQLQVAPPILQRLVHQHSSAFVSAVLEKHQYQAR